MAAQFEKGDALLLVDPQIDFCPGGSLAVPDGDVVIPVLNAWSAAAEQASIPIFITRDWHPPRTTHFAEFGGVWPPHCIAGTLGAAFHPALVIPVHAIVVSKGMGDSEDAYSAFHARDADGTPLATLLRAREVKSLYILGLATDYCVKESVLAGLHHGFRMTVVPDGVRAVNLRPQDGDNALAEMLAAGAGTL
jgi:nicotinamidase/pyrazinamidase